MIRALPLLLLATPATAQGIWTVQIEHAPGPLPQAPCTERGKLSGWPNPARATDLVNLDKLIGGYLFIVQSCGFMTRAEFNREREKSRKAKFPAECRGPLNPQWFGNDAIRIRVSFWDDARC